MVHEVTEHVERPVIASSQVLDGHVGDILYLEASKHCLPWHIT
jgi:hypothetical protein